MPDYFGLPDAGDRSQTFNCIGGTTFGAAGAPYQAWNKPRGISMVHIFALSSGGGGGGGCTGATSTQRGGGGGGGSGGFASGIFPAWALPDILHIFVPPGGAGGAAGIAGSTGAGFAILTLPAANTQMSLYVLIGSTGAGGGAAGTSAAGGAFGAAGTALSNYWNTVMNLGIIGVNPLSSNGVPGQAGVVGSASGAALPTGAGNFTVFSGGAGGAGCTSGNVDSAGGGYSTASLGIPVALAGGAAGGGRGADGYMLNKPIFGMGGMGGGSFSAGTGGNGGNGAYGCGGGGGGGGITGGAGGNGGPGLVIVTCWLQRVVRREVRVRGYYLFCPVRQWF